MTEKEREKMINDTWPVYTQKDRDNFAKFLREAPKAKIFDVDECQCCRDKRFV